MYHIPNIAAGLLYLLMSSAVLAQETGQIEGTVSDASNGEKLPSANIYFEGTSVGTATDLEGGYRLRNVPVGEQTHTVGA